MASTKKSSRVGKNILKVFKKKNKQKEKYTENVNRILKTWYFTKSYKRWGKVLKKTQKTKTDHTLILWFVVAHVNLLKTKFEELESCI